MDDLTPELSRVVAFANGKGGAGKTSVSVNCAGLAAAAGWRTLFIDLDPQGNAGEDLGYNQAGSTDNGQHLLDALGSSQKLAPVLSEVRPNLDVIPGGEALDDLESILVGRAQRSKQVHSMLAEALTPLAGEYDLIVLDTPPTRPSLLQVALGATRWIVVPTKPDRASILGLGALATQIIQVRQFHPDIDVLGAVLFDVSTSAKAVRRNAIQDITDALGGAAPLFKSVIRHTETCAVQSREEGKLIHELAEQVEDAEPYWKALKEGRTPTRVPGSAPALAEDYVLLCQEILQRIAQMESADAEDEAV
ncbi:MULTISPECIES: ParA family protein [Williamsia]|uniref:Cellulose biosynthesis protein BcsQ n=1 Tax=Williamsia marianensis TaxID=85044 RepID=A0A315SCH3_WILMA|nr:MULTISPECIES: ParA family protein [Williamsia]PZU02029.1 MAG: ParA family protein [Gordonia sp. (in: high G+C Gram-positive bacteria)]ETD34053.1 ParA [Williamsia sp. D3]MDV7137214.1 ParA family protein [Williamsia muralis]PVY26316.1 cellulose biosynthesis protein BcsQ [Williamsia marianensis]RKR79901.1 cellulose biosynthesis protein BcsQ [Williamsia muralis]